MHRGACFLAWLSGVATVSRIEKIISLFCRISSLLQGSFAEYRLFHRALFVRIWCIAIQSHARSQPRTKTAAQENAHYISKHTKDIAIEPHSTLPLSPTMSFALSIFRTLALLRFCVLTLLLSRFLAFLHSRERWGAGVETHFQEIS